MLKATWISRIRMTCNKISASLLHENRQLVLRTSFIQNDVDKFYKSIAKDYISDKKSNKINVIFSQIVAPKR